MKKFLLVLAVVFSLVNSQTKAMEKSAFQDGINLSSSKYVQVATGVVLTGMAVYGIYYGGSTAWVTLNDYLGAPFKKMAEQQICCMAAGEWVGGKWDLNLPTLFDNLPEPFKTNCYFIASRSCQITSSYFQTYLASFDAAWNRLPYCCQESVYAFNYTKWYLK
jgi:hypothetical protein